MKIQMTRSDGRTYEGDISLFFPQLDNNGVSTYSISGNFKFESIKNGFVLISSDESNLVIKYSHISSMYSGKVGVNNIFQFTTANTQVTISYSGDNEDINKIIEEYKEY